MNWKLSFQLSMFGLIMAFGTIALIPDKAEPWFWLIIFIACAYVLAKVCKEKYFSQGFWVSIFNSLSITVAHILFYQTYANHHPELMKSFAQLSMHQYPRLSMLILAAVFGVLSGVVQGLFSFVASKLVKPNAA